MTNSTTTSTIETKQLPAQRVAAVRVQASEADVFSAIPDGLGRVLASLASHDVTPMGAPISLFHAFPTPAAPADLSTCVPIAAAVESIGPDVDVFDLAGGDVVSLVHVGHYADLQNSYKRLAEWLAANNKDVTGPSREIYLNSPGEVDDADLLTEIQFPVA